MHDEIYRAFHPGPLAWFCACLLLFASGSQAESFHVSGTINQTIGVVADWENITAFSFLVDGSPEILDDAGGVVWKWSAYSSSAPGRVDYVHRTYPNTSTSNDGEAYAGNLGSYGTTRTYLS